MHHGVLIWQQGYGDSGAGDRAGGVDWPLELADDVWETSLIGTKASSWEALGEQKSCRSSAMTRPLRLDCGMTGRIGTGGWRKAVLMVLSDVEAVRGSTARQR